MFVTESEYEVMKEKYPIVSTIPTEGGMDIQVVAEKIEEGVSAKAIEPNLEHAYVYYMDFVLKDKLDMQTEKQDGGDLFK